MREANTTSGEYPLVKKTDILGDVLRVVTAPRQITTKQGIATLYEVENVTKRAKQAFFGASVLDKQEIQAGDTLKLALQKSKTGRTYLIGVPVK